MTSDADQRRTDHALAPLREQVTSQPGPVAWPAEAGRRRRGPTR